jgi:hypothetical protein
MRKKFERCEQKVLYTYKDIVDGQEVTVTRYAPAEHFIKDQEDEILAAIEVELDQQDPELDLVYLYGEDDDD